MSLGSNLPARRPLTARLRSGFTLVELLTVIAIIAILAALLFPVFSRMAAQARMNSCMTNVKSIVQAMQMYKDDHGVYPDGLYGVAYGAAAPLEPRLYPTYVKDQGVFTCPNHLQTWKGDNTLVQPLNKMTNAAAVDPYGRTLFYPRRDSYDMQYRPNTAAGTALLNYSRKWTTTAAGISDDPRQLIYKNPPDSTVVTVCLYHSDMDAAGNPSKGAMSVVGFLSGRVQAIPAEKVASWPAPDNTYPWQVAPKP